MGSNHGPLPDQFWLSRRLARPGTAIPGVNVADIGLRPRMSTHHNPMEPCRNERAGLYRPVVPARIPRSVPDAEFNEIFARLPSHRDRALVAFYVSTATQGGVDPGRQLIAVTRKGSRVRQEVPAAADAFVWLRLYQAEMDGRIPKGRSLPLWWTLRQPARPLTYHAAHRMFERAARAAGSAATLHALRPTGWLRTRSCRVDEVAMEHDRLDDTWPTP